MIFVYLKKTIFASVVSDFYLPWREICFSVIFEKPIV